MWRVAFLLAAASASFCNANKKTTCLRLVINESDSLKHDFDIAGEECWENLGCTWGKQKCRGAYIDELCDAYNKEYLAIPLGCANDSKLPSRAFPINVTDIQWCESTFRKYSVCYVPYVTSESIVYEKLPYGYHVRFPRENIVYPERLSITTASASPPLRALNVFILLVAAAAAASKQYC